MDYLVFCFYLLIASVTAKSEGLRDCAVYSELGRIAQCAGSQSISGLIIDNVLAVYMQYDLAKIPSKTVAYRLGITSGVELSLRPFIMDIIPRFST